MIRDKYSVHLPFILQRYIPKQVIRSSYIYSAMMYSGTGISFFYIYSTEVYSVTGIPFFLLLFHRGIFRNMYFVLLTCIPQIYNPRQVFCSSYIYSKEVYSGTSIPFFLHLFCSDIFQNR